MDRLEEGRGRRLARYWSSEAEYLGWLSLGGCLLAGLSSVVALPTAALLALTERWREVANDEGGKPEDGADGQRGDLAKRPSRRKRRGVGGASVDGWVRGGLNAALSNTETLQPLAWLCAVGVGAMVVGSALRHGPERGGHGPDCPPGRADAQHVVRAGSLRVRSLRFRPVLTVGLVAQGPGEWELAVLPMAVARSALGVWAGIGSLLCPPAARWLQARNPLSGAILKLRCVRWPV